VEETPDDNKKSKKRLRQFTLAMLPLIVFGWGGEIKAQPKEIVEGAKKEGQLVFYSCIPIPDRQAILSAMEKKYRFIKTTFYRSTGSALVSRIQTEQRAGTQIWDAIKDEFRKLLGIK
jgi:hypothetical protein